MTTLEVLGNPEARHLLLASFLRARTARDLSERTGIPVARCYRMLHRLRLLGLTRIERIHVTTRGRGKPLFRSQLPGLEFILRAGRPAARVGWASVPESHEEP